MASFDVDRATSHARLRALPGYGRGDCATFTREAISKLAAFVSKEQEAQRTMGHIWNAQVSGASLVPPRKGMLW